MAAKLSEESRLPSPEKVRTLFEPHLPCDDPKKLRRVYLQLAFRYHPDRWPEADRGHATRLFQAIANVYNELVRGKTYVVEPRVKSPVAAAAEVGDLEELRRLLEEMFESAVEEDEVGICPLMFAAKGGCLEAVELLLRHGADLCAKTPLGWSVLLFAVLNDHASMVSGLVELGARVIVQDLIIAAATGNAEGLGELLKFFDGQGGASALRSKASGKTLLHIACEGMCNLRRNSPARYAACIDLLIRCGVPTDAVEPLRGRTCLQNFIGEGNWLEQQFEASEVHLAVVHQLCSAGASPSTLDFEGNSAMSLADSLGLPRVHEILLHFVEGSGTTSRL
eukprot:gnl/TRDRNA2_/TRDRNA2_42569_c0_seq1.p1 gnl/TRDRNA2_/TRDRNA2_42569_c0~~gnl/TRDRNA2_/TRDRNA2_42569_c0_seq1.p1  ORF type:complete len:363 (+),score=57.73 gnl/TRDRNA2_/TRDRNA2_42569_c0_seq1:80-1090(+)